MILKNLEESRSTLAYLRNLTRLFFIVVFRISLQWTYSIIGSIKWWIFLSTLNWIEFWLTMLYLIAFNWIFIKWFPPLAPTTPLLYSWPQPSIILLLYSCTITSRCIWMVSEMLFLLLLLNQLLELLLLLFTTIFKILKDLLKAWNGLHQTTFRTLSFS